ncbi:glycosyltransferase family 9 protein [Citrobacter freundii]|nr:glycosyltransferase family 9 protein [Citrobacter freundii]EMF0721018.1 glycosyltransferase family 9 protein [Citrobacter freundii]
MKKLKVYISESFFTLEQQLLDHLGSFEKENGQSIFISPLANRLNGEALSVTRALIIPHKHHPEYYDHIIMKLCSTIAEKNFSHIEIHFPVTASLISILSFNLIRNINKIKTVTNIKLHVWDGVVEDLICRHEFLNLKKETLNSSITRLLSEFQLMIENLDIKYLFRFDTAFMFYFWHYIFNTDYHFVRPDLVAENNNKKFTDKLLKNTVPIDYECIKKTDKKIQLLYMKILGITGDIFLRLKKYVADNTLILTYADATYRKSAQFKMSKRDFNFHFDEYISKQDVLNQYSRLVINCVNVSDNYRECLSGREHLKISYEEQCSMFFLHALGVVPENIAGHPDLYLLAFPINRVSYLFLYEDLSFHRTKQFGKLLFSAGYQGNILYSSETKNLLNRNDERQLDDMILIKMKSSLGDCMFALSAVKALYAATKKKITFVTHRAYTQLAECNPWIDKVIAIEDLSDHALIDYFYEETQRSVHFCEVLHILADCHQIDACLRSVGAKINPKEMSMDIDLSRHDLTRVDEFFTRHNLNDENIVLLHANIGDPNRTWSGENWNILAEKFIHLGWKVVAIGSTNNKYAETQVHAFNHPAVINAVDQFSILESIHLMRKCQLLVATDSGPVALAGASDIAIVSLYSIVAGHKRIPYRHGRLGWNALCVNLKCKYGHCMNLAIDAKFCRNVLGTNIQMRRLNNWCPLGDVQGDKFRYSCIKNYSAEKLFPEIMVFLSSEKFVMQRHTGTAHTG